MGLSRFADPNYLKQRVLAEAEVRKAFIAKGGKPQLEQPIYFFLGGNKRFEPSVSGKMSCELIPDLGARF